MGGHPARQPKAKLSGFPNIRSSRFSRSSQHAPSTWHKQMIASLQEATAAIDRAWSVICDECLMVLGSELHYQAMIYYALRSAGGVPVDQLGMNVKQWIPNVRSELFQKFDLTKHEEFRGGFEPIPDIVIFSPDIAGDWRRRSRAKTISCMLAVIEVKASERAGGRLSRKEVLGDIRKLAAHREEVRYLGYDLYPIMIVVDAARDAAERMTPSSISASRELARESGVEWRYISPEERHVDRPAN